MTKIKILTDSMLIRSFHDRRIERENNIQKLLYWKYWNIFANSHNSEALKKLFNYLHVSEGFVKINLVTHVTAQKKDLQVKWIMRKQLSRMCTSVGKFSVKLHYSKALKNVPFNSLIPSDWLCWKLLTDALWYRRNTCISYA